MYTALYYTIIDLLYRVEVRILPVEVFVYFYSMVQKFQYWKSKKFRTYKTWVRRALRMYVQRGLEKLDLQLNWTRVNFKEFDI